MQSTNLELRSSFIKEVNQLKHCRVLSPKKKPSVGQITITGSYTNPDQNSASKSQPNSIIKTSTDFNFKNLTNSEQKLSLKNFSKLQPLYFDQTSASKSSAVTSVITVTASTIFQMASSMKILHTPGSHQVLKAPGSESVGDKGRQ